jgi:virulence-associated protein VagC
MAIWKKVTPRCARITTPWPEYRRSPIISITARLIMDGDSQVVLLPDEFRFEGAPRCASPGLGDKVILEPISKKPSDVAAWRASLAKYRDIPFHGRWSRSTQQQ